MREQLCLRNARVEKAMNTAPSTVAEVSDIQIFDRQQYFSKKLMSHASLTLLQVQGSVCAVGEVDSCGYGLGLAKASQKHRRAVSPTPSKARKDKQISR